MLDLAAAVFGELGLTGDAWEGEQTARAARVAMRRAYYRGEHVVNISSEMKAILGIKSETYRMADNYCDLIVDSIADRLIVERLEVEQAQGAAGVDEWLEMVNEASRFSELQSAVHTAAIMDGAAWIMVDYDAALESARLVQEYAYDGISGIVTAQSSSGEILAAAKLWLEGETERVNLYLSAEALNPERADELPPDAPGEVRRYSDGELIEPPAPLPFIPLVAMMPGNAVGGAELDDIIPLQDSLNSVLVSMVAASLLTGFPIYLSKNLEVKGKFTPGTVLMAETKLDSGGVLSKEEADMVVAMATATDIQRIDPGDISPLIEQAHFLKGEISTVSSTPIPATMGSHQQSGEALKQREVRLLGKLQRAQVTLGGGWTQALMLAVDTQALYGSGAPGEDITFQARWRSAEVRNNQEVRETAKLVHEWGFTREALRMLSKGGIVEYSEEDIDRLIEEQQADNFGSLGEFTADAIVVDEEQPALPAGEPVPA